MSNATSTLSGGTVAAPLSHATADASVSKAEFRARRLANRRVIVLIQVLCYAIGAVVLMLFAFAGAIPMWVPSVHFIGSLLLVGLFHVLSQRSPVEDNNCELLTVCEFGINIVIQLCFAWIVPQIAFSFFAALFVMFSIAALNISVRQTFVMFVLTCCGVLTVAVTSSRPVGMVTSTPFEQMAAFASYASMLFQISMVGCYGSSIRAKLQRQRIKLNEANQKISEIASIDGLTGVANRRVVMSCLDEQVALFQTNRAPCALAMFDIDWFKAINDSFGHPVGDDVLQTFAVTVSANLRDTDLFGRYGGEEFLLILPHTSASEAERSVDRLRLIIAELNWSAIASGMRVTMSAGVTAMSEADTTDEMLSRVDAALYRSKQTGRNRVTLAT